MTVEQSLIGRTISRHTLIEAVISVAVVDDIDVCGNQCEWRWTSATGWQQRVVNWLISTTAACSVVPIVDESYRLLDHDLLSSREVVMLWSWRAVRRSTLLWGCRLLTLYIIQVCMAVLFMEAKNHLQTADFDEKLHSSLYVLYIFRPSSRLTMVFA